ncbi:hypothetical protein DMA11_09090 [Marinilabiliaceae bacterium JC017]|nr:hypothetical protein DMA11_09090 [Marinilabiliaceae bacterium JC017]
MKSICTYFLSLQQLRDLGEILNNSIHVKECNAFHESLQEVLSLIKTDKHFSQDLECLLNEVHGDDMLCFRYWNGLKHYVSSMVLWPDEPVSKAAKLVLDCVAGFEHQVPGVDYKARASCFNRFLSEINKPVNLSRIKEIGARRWIVCLETSQRAFDIACNNYLKLGSEEALQQSLFGRYKLEMMIRRIYADLISKQKLFHSKSEQLVIEKIESLLDKVVSTADNSIQYLSGNSLLLN